VNPVRLAVATAACLSAAVLVMGPPGGARSEGAGPCQIDHWREVRLSDVALGADIRLTTTLRLDCDRGYAPLNVVLVIDASEQMTDRSRNWLTSLVAELGAGVQAMGLRQAPWARVGVVSFRDRAAQTEVFLTNSPEAVSTALHNIVLRNGLECPQCGLREGLRKARRMLQSGRTGGVPAREVIVIASRGFEPYACDAVRAAAGDLRPFGTLVVTACAGAGCDRRCLFEAASSPSYAFSGSDWSYLPGVLADMIALRGPFAVVADMGLEERLGDLVVYGGDAGPGAGTGQRLSWVFPAVPGRVITHSYTVRATSAGAGPVSREAYAWLRYQAAVSGGMTQTHQLPRPEIVVRSIASPTRPSPPVPPTATPSGGAGPTPTAERAPTGVTPHQTPSPTAGRESRRPVTVFLALVSTGACPAGGSPLDLVLLVDVSGSMAASDVPPFVNRWAAAGAIGEELVRYHTGPDDRVAVIPFAERAEVRAALEDGRAAALEALRSLPKWDGSRMDVAVAAARAELERGRPQRPQSVPVVVLLTDGDLNQTELARLEAGATGLRQWGARFLAVALGADADPLVLARVTGSRGRVYETGPGTSPLALAETVGRALRCDR